MSRKHRHEETKRRESTRTEKDDERQCERNVLQTRHTSMMRLVDHLDGALQWSIVLEIVLEIMGFGLARKVLRTGGFWTWASSIGRYTARIYHMRVGAAQSSRKFTSGSRLSRSALDEEKRAQTCSQDLISYDTHDFVGCWNGHQHSICLRQIGDHDCI